MHGPWVGWSHHHWLADVDPEPARITFTFKPHLLHGRPEAHFPAGFAETLTADERVSTLWWQGGFEAAERVVTGPADIDGYLADFVAAELARRGWPAPAPPPPDRPDGLQRRVRRAGRELLGRR